MALKLIYGGGATAGAANGTLVSSGNPIVFTALDTPVACFIRADDDTYSPDASFSPPSDGQVQVSFTGTGGPWYAFGTNPNAYGADIGDLNVAIHLRQHANATGATGLLQTDYSTNPNATALADVTGFSGTGASTSVALSWSAVTNRTAYRIDRATNAGFTTGVALDISPGQTSTSFSDTGLSNNTTYYYRIKAVGTNRYKDSANYATTNVLTLTPGRTAFAVTAGSQPIQPFVGPDGNIWVGLNLNNSFARITPTGTVTEFALTTGTGPIGGCSDGTNCWIACSSGHLVKLSGSLSGTPTQTAYNLTAAYDVVLGPDESGTRYLYVSGGDATIRKVNPSTGALVTGWGTSGVATLASGGSIRFGVSDGTRLFFADRTYNSRGAVVRCELTGASPLTATQGPDASADLMALAWDGSSLFVVGQASGKIYPVTNGTTQTYGTSAIVGNAAALPTGICYNPADGKIYSAGYHASWKNLYASPSGTLSFSSVAATASGAGAWGLCAHPNGTVWLAENTATGTNVSRFVP